MWNSARVLALRKLRQESQGDFAKRVGVNRVTVSEWERGASEVSPLSQGALDQLERATRYGSEASAPLRVAESPSQYDAVLATVIATGENRARLGVVQGYAQFVLDQLIELARRQQQVVDGMRPFSEAEGQALAANVTPEQIPEVLASIRQFRARQASGDAPADPRQGTG